MHKLGLIGNHISKSLTTSLFKDLSDYFDIPLTYELFDLKEKYSPVVPPTTIPWIFFFKRNLRISSKDPKSIS